MPCGAVVSAGEAYSHELCPKCIALAEPTSEQQEQSDGRMFHSQHCNVPPRHIEMPCGRILPDAEAALHTGCVECSDAIDKSARDQALSALRMRVHDKVTDWDHSEGLILEDAVPQVVDFFMSLLGLEVLACAFCGEKYEGDKPVPRAQLAAHIRRCESHPLKREIVDLRRRLQEERRWYGVLESVGFALSIELRRGFCTDSVERQILKSVRDGAPRPHGCLRCTMRDLPLDGHGWCVPCTQGKRPWAGRD